MYAVAVVKIVTPRTKLIKYLFVFHYVDYMSLPTVKRRANMNVDNNLELTFHFQNTILGK